MIAAPKVAGVNDVIEQLRRRFDDRMSCSPAICAAHGKGEGLHDCCPPDAVVFVEDSDEVSFILSACSRAGVPVIPFGAGTSLEGQVQAVRGGICIDMSRMARILSINEQDLDCRVEAGVTREQLNLHLRDKGLFFPVDPGADATFGGMASTRASGTNAVRYGTMRDVTLGLTVVTPDGSVIRTGTRARKSSAGYDLTRLYIGSEGALGVITELQLRLFGIPEQIASCVCQFETLDDAVGAVVRLLHLGVPLARVELLDSLQMRASIAFSRLHELEERPTLFLELHGSPAAVAEQIEQLQLVCADAGGSALKWALNAEERSRLWRARHQAYHASRALAPGKESFATDACVPISALAQCISDTHCEAEASGLICPIVGHVGDGNFHVLVLFDPACPSERARADALCASISERAIAAGGTCSGEHGIGLHKLAGMNLEHGPAIAVMQRIKSALDPLSIMNPGKTVPVDCAGGTGW